MIDCFRLMQISGDCCYYTQFELSSMKGRRVLGLSMPHLMMRIVVFQKQVVVETNPDDSVADLVEIGRKRKLIYVYLYL